jgi:hypothetical protein
MHVPGFNRTSQRGPRREQPALSNHFIQRARTDALGKRTQGIAIDAQQIARTIGGGRLAWGHEQARDWVRRPS